jgi:hypothetical protein
LQTDAAQNLRIYALSLVPQSSMDQLLWAWSEAGGQPATEPWSIWVPTPRHPSDPESQAIGQAARAALVRAEAPSFVVGALDLLESVLAWREVPAGEASRVIDSLERAGRRWPLGTGKIDARPTPYDWFAYLGLDPSAYLHIDDDDGQPDEEHDEA